MEERNAKRKFKRLRTNHTHIVLERGRNRKTSVLNQGN